MMQRRGYLAVLAISASMLACENKEQEQSETFEPVKNTVNEVKQKLNETNADDVKREWSEFKNTLMAYSADERSQAVASVEKELQQIDSRIDELEQTLSEQTSQLSESAAQDKQQLLQTLRTKRKELQVWSDKMGETTAVAWEDVKEGFANAYASLSRSFKEAKQEIQSSKQQQ